MFLRGAVAREVDSRVLIAAFESQRWRDAARALRAGVSVCAAVVDLRTGATIASQEPIELCGALDDKAAGPSVGCLVTSSGSAAVPTSPATGTCQLGMPYATAPVRVDGKIACHVLLTGYVESDRGLKRLRERLIAEGLDTARVEHLLESIPTLDRERAQSVARLMATLGESLVSDALKVSGPRSRDREISVLADLTAGIAPGEMPSPDAPGHALRSILRLAGAEGARIVYASEETGDLEVLAESGDCTPLGRSELKPDELVRRVIDTDRSTVIARADEDADGTISVVAVPLHRTGRAAGSLVLCRRDSEPLSADDIRIVELAAELLSAMLDNASEYVAVTTRLVELIQVNEVAQVLNSTLDYEQLAELAIHVLSKALDFDVGGFVVDAFGEQHGRLVHLVDISETDLKAVAADAAGVDADEAFPSALCVSSLMCELLEADTATVEDWTVLSRELVSHDVRIGTLFVASSVAGRFRAQDERILAALCDHLSIALENAMLYQRLAGDFDRAMGTLSALADANERFAHGHTDRVMDYAVAVAEEIGLPIARVQLVRFAGLLHDLGKTGVADDILVKPSALTPDEMERVRRHSELGASIVEQISILDELSPIVRYHHEFWDGRGYPDGLMREEIPLEARILAVADAFEAMTGKRAHRKAMPASAARIEIERAAGTQFDPDVVAAFGRVIDRRTASGATGAFAPGMTAGTEPHLPA